MREEQADSRNYVRRERKRNYAPDKPKDCGLCYFWKGRQRGCSQAECYYLLPEEAEGSEELLSQKSDGTGNCRYCPYGRHSRCIGYCIQKVILEMKEKKQKAGKEGCGIAG